MVLINDIELKFTDQRLSNWLKGPCYLWPDKISKLIEDRINDEKTYSYPTVSAFMRSILPKGPYLTIQDEHPIYNDRYRIQMSGSRLEDYNRANIVSGAGKTPDNYTWHHRQEIDILVNNYYCYMYLLKTSYHSSWPHKGGVFEYEQYKGKYKP